MVLEIELSLAIDTDRTTQVLSDDTEYGTGGNPARADVLVFVQAQKVNYDNEAEDLDTDGDQNDPATDSEWVITYTDDGFYRYYVSIIEDEYNIGTTYAIYDAVYSGTNVYRSKTNGNVGQSLSNTTYWEAISEPALLAANEGLSTESLNITSTAYLRVLSANAQFEYGNQLSNQNPREADDNDQALREYNIFAKMLDEAAIADSRSEVLEGELICSRMTARFITA